MQRSVPWLAEALACASAAVLLVPTATSAAVPAAGGVRVIACLERTGLGVVGEVLAPRALDAHGRAARLALERALGGDFERGARIAFAWEERALARPERFAEGDRVLLCLEPLPLDSIWRQRLPEAGERMQTLLVAERGEAFLRSPSLGGLGILEHYLELSPADRAGADGVGRLVQLAAGAELPLARAAVERLGGFANLDALVEGPAARGLVDALQRADAEGPLRDALLDLIEEKRLETLRPLLQARAAGPGEPPLEIVTALARLDGRLPPERSAALLDHPEARVRTVAARYATGAAAERRLAVLARSDRVPEVRAAAVTRLVALRGRGALDTALAVLSDPELRVRGAAGRAIATLGNAALPNLVRVVETGEPEAAQAAVAALRWTETREAHDALVEIADSHPDESVRTLAALAVGRPLDASDH